MKTATKKKQSFPEIDMNVPLYSVDTWDTERQWWTPQEGLTKSRELTRAELVIALRELRAMGYMGYRNDPSILVDRM